MRNVELTTAAAGLFGAAAVWPHLYDLLRWLLLSPYERLLQTGWCGHALNEAVLLGHCSGCWMGAAGFASAGMALLMVRGQVVQQLPSTRSRPAAQLSSENNRTLCHSD